MRWTLGALSSKFCMTNLTILLASVVLNSSGHYKSVGVSSFVISDMPSSVPDSSSDFPSTSPSLVPSETHDVVSKEKILTQSSDIASDFPSILIEPILCEKQDVVEKLISLMRASDTPSIVPSRVTSDNPSMQPSVVPTIAINIKAGSSSKDLSSDTPSIAPSTIPSNIHFLGQSSRSIISGSDSPSMVPSDIPSGVPNSTFLGQSSRSIVSGSDSPSMVPSDIPSGIPHSTFLAQSSRSVVSGSDSPSMVPSDIPSGVPSSTFLAQSSRSIISGSDSPSIVPSDIPSGVPSSTFLGQSSRSIISGSDSPSMVPSDIPSGIPSSTFRANFASDAPSTQPSTNALINEAISTSEPTISTVSRSIDGTILHNFFVVPEPILLQLKQPETMDRDTVATFELVCSNDFLPSYIQLVRQGTYQDFKCEVIDQTVINGEFTAREGGSDIGDKDSGIRRLQSVSSDPDDGIVSQLEVILSVSGLSSIAPDTEDMNTIISETFTTYEQILDDKLSAESNFFHTSSASAVTRGTSFDNVVNQSNNPSPPSNFRWHAIIGGILGGATISILISLFVLRRAIYGGKANNNSASSSLNKNRSGEIHSSGSGGSRSKESRVTGPKLSKSSGSSTRKGSAKDGSKYVMPINSTATVASDFPNPGPMRSINTMHGICVDLESDISNSLADEYSVCHRTVSSHCRTADVYIENESSKHTKVEDSNSLGGIILSVSGVLRSLNENISGLLTPNGSQIVHRKSKTFSNDDERRSDTSSELEGMKLLGHDTSKSKCSSKSVTPLFDSILSNRSRNKGVGSSFQMFMSESASDSKLDDEERPQPRPNMSRSENDDKLDAIVCSRSRSNNDMGVNKVTTSTARITKSNHKHAIGVEDVEVVEDNSRRRYQQFKATTSSNKSDADLVESPPKEYDRAPLPPRVTASTSSEGGPYVTQQQQNQHQQNVGSNMQLLDTVKKSNRRQYQSNDATRNDYGSEYVTEQHQQRKQRQNPSGRYGGRPPTPPPPGGVRGRGRNVGGSFYEDIDTSLSGTCSL